MQLDTTRSLVTGAASGMGRFFVHQLAAAGGAVHAVDVDEAGLASLAAELQATGLGAKVTTGRCDVSSETDAAEAIAAARKAMGGLNVLVNSAGICTTRPSCRPDA